MSQYRRTRFVIDSLPGKSFEGVTDGSDWNGWACPRFERAEAERVLRASEPNGFAWTYDQASDQFVVTNESDDADSAPEVFRATTVRMNGERIKVYPVGAWSWIWEEAEHELER